MVLASDLRAGVARQPLKKRRPLFRTPTYVELNADLIVNIDMHKLNSWYYFQKWLLLHLYICKAQLYPICSGQNLDHLTSCASSPDPYHSHPMHELLQCPYTRSLCICPCPQWCSLGHLLMSLLSHLPHNRNQLFFLLKLIFWSCDLFVQWNISELICTLSG